MSSSSGIKLCDEAKRTFEDFKKRKDEAFILFKIVDKKSIVVDYVSETDENFSCFDKKVKELFNNNECRYAAFFFNYQTKTEKQNRCKLIFLLCSPEGAKTMDKMHYTTSMSSIKNSLQIDLSMEVHDTDDLSFTEVETYLNLKFQ